MSASLVSFFSWLNFAAITASSSAATDSAVALFTVMTGTFLLSACWRTAGTGSVSPPITRQRVEVCNALETLLVDRQATGRLLPALGEAFAREHVELRGCSVTRSILSGCPAASPEDWATEYLGPILALKVVDGLDEAIHHINAYGSGHTDGIVTQRLDWAQQFVGAVDSASVLVNASTRLSPGC